MIKLYFAQNKNLDTVQHSSSGGLFSLLADYTIAKSGVVFGASFDESFNVKITYTENDYSSMLGSKYVKSDINNS